MIGIFIVFASGCGLATVLFIWGKFYDRYLRIYVDKRMTSISSRFPSRFRSPDGGNHHDDVPISTDSVDISNVREDMIPPPSAMENPQPPTSSFFPTTNDMDNRLTTRKRPPSFNGNEGASYF